MDKIRHNHPEIAPPAGQFSRSIRAGDFLFIAGTTARGSAAEAGSMCDQILATINTIRRIIEAEGGSLQDIVRTTTYVTSIEEWRACAAEREAFTQEAYQGNFPTDALIEIKGLASPTLKIEIEATAVL